MGGCHWNTLQYITVSPGQEGCTWLHPDHSPPPTHTCIHKHPAALSAHLDAPRAGATKRKTSAEMMAERHITELFFQNVLGSVKWKEALHSTVGSFFKFTPLYLTHPQFFECFTVTFFKKKKINFKVLLLSHYKTYTHTHASKKLKIQLIQTEMAKRGS